MKKLTLLLILCSEISYSCDIECPTISEMYSYSTHVFIAEISQVKKYGFNLFRNEPKIKVKFMNIQNIKGDWQHKEIRTIQNKSSCQGVGFKEKEKYIAFVDGIEDFHFCNTFTYDEYIEEEIQELIDGNK